MKKFFITCGAMLGLLPLTAMAHSGHEVNSFMHGILHPLTGIDHILVILAVGFLAARSAGKLEWQLPAMFFSVMMVGVSLGLLVNNLSLLESTISMTVFAMALVIALATKLKPFIQYALIAVFAVLHGIVHGQGLSLLDSSLLIIPGMLVASIALLFAGLFLGRYKNRIGAKIQNVLITLMTFVGVIGLFSY